MALPLFLMAAGVSAFGSIRGGILANKQGELAQAEGELSAQLTMEKQARDDRDLAQAQQARRGAMTAQFAAGGVDVTGGSPLEAVLVQARIDAITRSRQQFIAQLQARGIRFAGDQRQQAGRNALVQGVLSGVGAGLTAQAFRQGGTSASLQQALLLGDTGSSGIDVRSNMRGANLNRLAPLN